MPAVRCKGWESEGTVEENRNSFRLPQEDNQLAFINAKTFRANLIPNPKYQCLKFKYNLILT